MGNCCAGEAHAIDKNTFFTDDGKGRTIEPMESI